MRSVVAFLHLPGANLQCDGFDVGGGRITRLPFATWQKLDPAFAFAADEYERAKPVFFVADAPIDDKSGEDEIWAYISAITKRIHAAILLEPSAPRLPSPALSACYAVVAVPDHRVNVTYRKFGGMEREWLLFGPDLSYDFNEAALAEVAAVFDMLAPLGGRAHPGAIAGIGALERTSRPDSWWGGGTRQHDLSDFVQCVAACENIVLGAENSEDTITQLFGRHAAALLSARQEHIEVDRQFYSGLYKLRSRIMHGRTSFGELVEDDWAKIAVARRMLRSAIVGALKFAAASADDLPAALSDASRSPEAFVQFRLRLMAAR